MVEKCHITPPTKMMFLIAGLANFFCSFQLYDAGAPAPPYNDQAENADTSGILRFPLRAVPTFDSKGVRGFEGQFGRI